MMGMGLDIRKFKDLFPPEHMAMLIQHIDTCPECFAGVVLCYKMVKSQFPILGMMFSDSDIELLVKDFITNFMKGDSNAAN